MYLSSELGEGETPHLSTHFGPFTKKNDKQTYRNQDPHGFRGSLVAKKQSKTTKSMTRKVITISKIVTG